jgi:hypothetical protein
VTTETKPYGWLVTDHATWRASSEGHRYEVKKWLRLHDIDPADVPADSPIMVCENAHGNWVIAYELYLRSEDGHIRIDPNNPGEAFVEERCTALEFDPPMHWLTPVL